MDSTTLEWGAHVVALAPALYLARNTPDMLAALLVVLLGYNLYRVFGGLYHGTCADADTDLFDALILVPLLFLGRKSPQLVSLVAALTALYFLGKMAMRYATTQRCPRA